MVSVKLRDFLVFFGRPTQRIGCCLVLFVLAVVSSPVSAGETSLGPLPKVRRPFAPGEKLTYIISWSDILNAGTAVMEVRKERSTAKTEEVRFVSSARSTGMLDKFYSVRDVVQSVFDVTLRQSLSYAMDQKHGKRKKQREALFDQDHQKVTFRENGVQEVLNAPKQTQDALSSLYYLRMSDDLVPGRTITVNVFDGGKNWTVDILVLSKEQIKTPAGDFRTIKVQTYPKYEGVFMHKGEIFIWITDDDRRVPVLMKSTITIGSIMATLTEMKAGVAGE